MTDQKPMASELLDQIDEFEKTLATLQNNLTGLRDKIVNSRNQYGDDVGNWPKL